MLVVRFLIVTLLSPYSRHVIPLRVGYEHKAFKHLVAPGQRFLLAVVLYIGYI